MTKGVHMGLSLRGPGLIQSLQRLQLIGEFSVHHASKPDLLFVLRPALPCQPMVDVDPRFRDGLVQLLQCAQTRDQNMVNLFSEGAAFRQVDPGDHQQDGHGQDEDPKTQTHAPRNVPTPLHGRWIFSSSARYLSRSESLCKA